MCKQGITTCSFMFILLVDDFLGLLQQLLIFPSVQFCPWIYFDHDILSNNHHFDIYFYAFKAFFLF